MEIGERVESTDEILCLNALERIGAVDPSKICDVARHSHVFQRRETSSWDFVRACFDSHEYVLRNSVSPRFLTDDTILRGFNSNHVRLNQALEYSQLVSPSWRRCEIDH